LIGRERATLALPIELQSSIGIEAMLAQVRADGVSIVQDYHLGPGVAAAGAPVFNFKHEITLSLLAIGVKSMIDLSPTGKVVTALKRCATNLSQRLGNNS